MQIQASAIYATFQQIRGTWSDYLSLTKPRVVSLLLLTTLAAMFIAGDRIPSLTIISLTLIGGYLAAGGAGALNCYLDYDIDQLMGRTRSRPLPAQRLSRRQALYFGLGLSGLAFLTLWLGANLLAAAVALLGTVWYVGIYTYWLKRRSPQNIVIGGAAGAFPPLVGWAAVTGTLSWEALLLFAIIFFWTPPHFWALALVLRQDYGRAGIPMLPVVRSRRATHWQMLGYSLVLVLLSLGLSLSGFMGPVYTGAALLLGGLFIYYTARLLYEPTIPATWRLFKYSLLYLALLFSFMVVDRLILG